MKVRRRARGEEHERLVPASYLASLPGIGVSLLPKLMCPMCWPAYAGVVSALGLGFLVSAKYLLALTVVLLAVTVAALGFGASRRHGYGPLWLTFAAVPMIFIGKFYFDIAQVVYVGVGLLIAASAWNSWPRRVVMMPICPATASASRASMKDGNEGT